MPHILLINRNGNSPKTYGIVDKAKIMKFPFIIGIFLWCCLQGVQSRVVNERQYLEYLNDLDRRNVEFDDIHHQWPFYSTVNDAQDGLGPSEDPEENRVLAELTNRLKNYRDRTPDNLNQYRRHKPLDTDSVIGLARVYPEPVDVPDDEVEPELQNDDNVYADVNSDKEEEELNRPPHHTPIFTSFPRIVIEQPNNFEHTYANIYGTEETEEQPEADQEEEEFVRPKPTFSPSYFPRIVVPDFKVGISDLDFGDKDSHAEEEYTFKPGEEFAQTIDFDKVPVPKDLAEFGVGPADSRFGREFPPPGDVWDYAMTPAPPREAVGRTYLLKTPSKPKMNSRSDLHQYGEPSDEVQLDTFVNKDVEVVPFKPDTETDSAGVYLIAIVAGISAAATVGLIAVGIGWYNLQKHMKNAEDSDYPSYGIVGPNKDYEKKERNDGDRKLAQSAQMYHYQHQKQQIIAMGRNNHQGHGPQSDSEEEEDEEGNYTVYECPGLASIEGPLEVKNPMFDDDQLATPSQTPSKNDK